MTAPSPSPSPRRYQARGRFHFPLVKLQRLGFSGASLQVLKPGEPECGPHLRRRLDLRESLDLAVGVLVHVNGPRHVRLHAPRGSEHASPCRLQPSTAIENRSARPSRLAAPRQRAARRGELGAGRVLPISGSSSSASRRVLQPPLQRLDRLPARFERRQRVVGAHCRCWCSSYRLGAGNSRANSALNRSVNSR
jgi:hypothetical protein